MTRALLGLTLVFVPVAAVGQAFDRSRPPELAPPPPFRTPAVHHITLSNGIQLYVVEMREVPLVQFTISLAGGSREDGDLPGLATFTANMLDEGAGPRDAAALAAEAAFLGASLATGASWDAMTATLRAPRRTMEAALDLLADVVLRPTFAAAEVGRQRDLRIAQLIQQRDQPAAVASLTFHRLVFPATHPYHRSALGDSASAAALDSAAVRGFYQRFARPDRTTVLVTGDISLAEAQRAVEARFGTWRGFGAPASRATTVPNPEPKRTRIYLVDKPGAAQSVIMIGGPGVPRDDPDYYALRVMNTLLGGSFSSRLMTNLRETRGYTYGASSAFQFRPLPGPFVASSAVRTDVTDSSLVEFFREFERIRDEPVPAGELERAKAYLALGLAGDFETTGQVAAQLAELLNFGLPLDYYDRFAPKILAVTAAEVQRVAQRLIRPDQMTIVIVGDVAKIRRGVEALGLAPVEVMP